MGRWHSKWRGHIVRFRKYKSWISTDAVKTASLLRSPITWSSHLLTYRSTMHLPTGYCRTFEERWWELLSARGKSVTQGKEISQKFKRVQGQVTHSSPVRPLYAEAENAQESRRGKNHSETVMRGLKRFDLNWCLSCSWKISFLFLFQHFHHPRIWVEFH